MHNDFTALKLVIGSPHKGFWGLELRDLAFGVRELEHAIHSSRQLNAQGFTERVVVSCIGFFFLQM